MGGISGHLCRGMSRSGVKEFGELIDQGEATLVIVGDATLRAALDTAVLQAEKQVAEELDMSVNDVDAAVREAAEEVS